MYYTVKLAKGTITQQYTQLLTAKGLVQLEKQLSLQASREPGLVYSIEQFKLTTA